MQTSLTDCLILWHQKTHLLSPKKKKGIFLSSKQALSPLFKSLQSFSTFCWVGCWWDRQIGGNQIASMCVVMGLSNKKALWHGAQPAAAAAASLNPLVRGRRGADTGPPRSAAPLRRPSRPLSIRRRRRRAAQNLDHLPWSAHLGTPYHTDLLALTDPLPPPPLDAQTERWKILLCPAESRRQQQTRAAPRNQSLEACKQARDRSRTLEATLEYQDSLTAANTI
jgi:hypothetical protein